MTFQDFSESGQQEILQLIRNGHTGNDVPFFRLTVTLKKGEGDSDNIPTVHGNITRDVARGNTCGEYVFWAGTYAWSISFDKSED